MAFFRRLLGEPEIPMPYKHPLIVSWLKVFSAGRCRARGRSSPGSGCPNGCDFCCTSHFFSRKHIKLLPEGKDIYAVVERYLDMDPNLVFLILDEDFLLNKKRAMEFRDCVMKGGKTLSIFAFSSIKAISQYTVEEILEMGIDGFWIGYEGTRSGYAKQQGRPVEEILTEFREHGITVLTSMIVGFDYQTPEVVAQELDGLMKLKPALAQFLIYGPVPGTPFYERVIKENLLHDVYTKDPDLFYRRADGFTTMIKHPTLSPAADRGDPALVFRARIFSGSARASSASWKRGCSATRSSRTHRIPSCARRRSITPRNCGMPIPVFLAGRLLGPNATVRRWIGDLERRIHAELGRPTLGGTIQVRAGRRRRAVDRADVEAGSFPASQTDADDLSAARQALERV